MKYIIKYLPVEGEIKKGDDIVTITGFVKKYNEDSLDVFQAPTKVKLFVCSRDIQIDDKVYHDTIIPNEGFIWTKSHQDKMRKDNVFKVIGEVSKGAIWVKEGDEFDEGQMQINYAFPVRITYRNGEKKDNIILPFYPDEWNKKNEAENWADTSGHGSCYGYTIYWDEEPIYIHNVTLKCSQCNTFH
jgi:hypothetical protein